MKLALLNGSTITSVGDYRTLFPNTSFPPLGPDGAFLAEHNALPVYDSVEYDPETHKLVTCEPYIVGDCVYTVQAQELSDAELDARALAACDYQGFWDALLISSVYQSIRAQSIQSLAVNTCCTEFIAAMTDAKMGRPNRDAIQACIWLLMAELTLSADEVTELQGLLADAQMDGVYTLQPG
jgi:hypothetical protein